MTAAEVEALIKSRRSFFPAQLTGKVLEDEKVWSWLQNARWAPTHKLTEPWRFKVFAGDAKQGFCDFIREQHLHKISDHAKLQKKLGKLDLLEHKVSHIIGIVMELNPKVDIPEMEEVAAVSCAVQNLYLSMSAYGIGGYWSTGLYTFTDEMKEYLGLNEHSKCMGFMIIGEPSDIQLESPRKPIEDMVDWMH